MTDWPGPDTIGHGDTVARPGGVPAEILALVGLDDADDQTIAVALGVAHPTPEAP